MDYFWIIRMTVNVVCMKWGAKFGPEYVNRLAGMVRRNLRAPYRFACFTDDAQGLDRRIEAYPCPEVRLPSGYPERGWRKLGIFSDPLADLEGPALFLDLDVAILGQLDAFFEHRADDSAHANSADSADSPGLAAGGGGFVMADDWDFPRRTVGNSSIFRFRVRGHADVLRDFVDNGSGIRKRFRNEQAYLTHAMRRKGALSFWPEAWVRSFKRHCLRPFPLCWFQTPRPPPGVRVVAFHGRPRPDEAMRGWTGKMGLRHVIPPDWLKTAWEAAEA